VNKRQNLSLDDEIWHLKYISKRGKSYEQLSKNGIYTVEDLLKEHESNPSCLQEVLRKKTLFGEEKLKQKDNICTIKLKPKKRTYWNRLYI